MAASSGPSGDPAAPEGPLRLAAVGLAFLAAYLAATHIGLVLRIEFGGLTPLWPAAGIALVLLIRRGFAWWPLIVIGELLTAWSLGQPLTMGVAGGAAEILSAVLAVLLLRRAGIRRWFTSVAGTVYICVVVCLLPPLASASIGAIAQLAHGVLAMEELVTGWFTWWLGDAMGLLIVAPFLMTWWPWPFRGWRETLEWACIAAVLLATGIILTRFTAERGDELFFLLLPFVGWLALRFRAAGAASASLILAALVFGLSEGQDNFSTAVYVAFVGASACMGYLLAAVITRQHALLGEFRRRADYDELTGLFSRSRLEIELRRLAEDRNLGPEHALIYIDLDHFKMVNDACGHAAGDGFLREFARHMSQGLPPEATLARMGADEFGVLVRNVGEREAESLGDQLRTRVTDFRYTCAGYDFTLGASIGIAWFRPGELIADVLSRADIACHWAKDEGRDRVHLYRDQDLAVQRHHTELAWVAHFRRTMDDGLLLLYGQQIKPLGDDEAPPFYEVLLRKLENGEAVSPGRFLPAATRYGLMPTIDHWVMTHCFELVAARPDRDFMLSINLAAVTIDRPRFFEDVSDLRDRYGVDPHRICFEVTEQIAIRDMTRAIDALERLSAMGFRFSLDDFGKGVSSFEYLARLPVQYVKLDGQFVRNLNEDRASRIIVTSVNELCALRGIRSVAEWVETEAVMKELRRIGVDFAQGFHIHEPEPLERVIGDAEPSAGDTVLS